MFVSACIATPSLQLRYAMLVIATCSVFGGLPPLCAWVSDNVRNTTAASLASGLNISFTGPGQIIGVWIYQNQQAPRYQTGHAVNAASMFLGVVFSLGLWLSYRRSNGRLAPGEQRWIA
jgi:predicted MFS family arabinose efflux permease